MHKQDGVYDSVCVCYPVVTLDLMPCDHQGPVSSNRPYESRQRHYITLRRICTMCVCALVHVFFITRYASLPVFVSM